MPCVVSRRCYKTPHWTSKPLPIFYSTSYQLTLHLPVHYEKERSRWTVPENILQGVHSFGFESRWAEIVPWLVKCNKVKFLEASLNCQGRYTFASFLSVSLSHTPPAKAAWNGMIFAALSTTTLFLCSHQVNVALSQMTVQYSTPHVAVSMSHMWTKELSLKHYW